MGDTSRENCGYPNYCARTDRKLEPCGQTPRALGRAGSVITDPSFGSRILRLTDEASDPGKPGMPFRTPSSAEQNSWSRSPLFYALNGGGRILLYRFDRSSFRATQLKLAEFGWRGEPQFSYSDDDLLYGVSNNSPNFQKYQVSKDKLSTIHDPATCLKLDSTAYGANITVSADDQRFMMVIGPKQDTNNSVYVYDVQKDCRWYNPMGYRTDVSIVELR